MSRIGTDLHTDSSDQSASIVRRLLDAGCIVLSHVTAFYAYPGDPNWLPVQSMATLLAVMVFYLFGESNGLYRPWRGMTLKREAAAVWKSWLFTIPVLIALGFVTKTSHQFSRITTVIWFSLGGGFFLLPRFALRLILEEFRRSGRLRKRVAIIGATEMGERLARRINESPWLGMHIEGFYDDREPDRLHKLPLEYGGIQGKLAVAVEKSRTNEFDIIYIALPLRAEKRIHDILIQLKDTTASVHMVADFFAFDLLRGRWGSIGDVPVVSLHDTPFYGVDGWVKRIEDIVLGSLALLIFAIPMLIIAIAVKLTSKGPVFFRQRRYGLNGEVIEVMKFRSMTTADDGADVKQATKGDARITKLGAFLRKTSLDELPQLINVVTGEMSLVGPRPHAVAHNELYRKKIRGYMLRHKVKPGITGWAQVNGWRGETDTLEKMEKRIEHDLDYIRNWDLFLDLKILFLTAIRGFTHKNAY